MSYMKAYIALQTAQILNWFPAFNFRLNVEQFKLKHFHCLDENTFLTKITSV